MKTLASVIKPFPAEQLHKFIHCTAIHIKVKPEGNADLLFIRISDLMAAQAKDLQIEFHFPEDFTITADESRIAQVVENFATNAMKYTPAGGHISVTIQTGHSGTSFRIENDSEPLSSEALSKVWDTFYRADEARSGGGTGLGLAIAKSIVELHGGKCSVRNTVAGVEFGFAI